MDSVTQLILGSTVGHAVGGKVLGRKAILWGAVIGTLPDLDVIFYPVLNDIEKIIQHRGISHSFFWQALSAPFIAFFITVIHRQFKHYWRWLFLVLFGFWTHSLIDWLTAYGTKVLIPFDDYPYALSSLFIIDPVFSLPLVIALLVGLFKPNKRSIAIIALALSTTYGITAWVVQEQVGKRAKIALQEQGISDKKVLITPMPFSILWWRIVAIDDHNWYEGVHILWDKKKSTLTLDRPIDFKKRSKNSHLLLRLKDSWSLDKLNRFSHGFYRLEESHNEDGIPQLFYSNLRMGFNEQYAFSYLVAEKWNGEWRVVDPAEKQNRQYDIEGIIKLLDSVR